MLRIKDNETYEICLNEKNKFDISWRKIEGEDLEYLLVTHHVSAYFAVLTYCYGKDIEKAKKLCIEEKIRMCNKNIQNMNNEIEKLNNIEL